VNSFSGPIVNSGEQNHGNNTSQTQNANPIISDTPPKPNQDSAISDVFIGNHTSAATQKTFEQRCEETLTSSKVLVDVTGSSTIFDYTKSVAELTALAENHSSNTLGLTISKPTVTFVWAMHVLEDDKTKRTCMRPQFRFLVSTGAQQVYVGKEFTQGSCAFKEIFEHEITHVEINKRIASEVAAETQKFVSESIGNRVIYGQNRQELEGYIKDAIDNHWLPHVAAQFKQREVAHDAIDNNAEYARVSNSCNGEIRTILENRSN
jgi:hypothetical protein